MGLPPVDCPSQEVTLIRPSVSTGAPSPLKGEGLRAATWGRPYGENGPGALVRQTQAQTWNRAKNKFCKLRAQWPGGNLDTHSNFTRRKRCTLSQECVPRNGVRGKRPMDLGGAKRSRSPSAASPVAFCLLFRHGKRRSPPAGGEIPLRKTNEIRNLSPHPSGLTASHLPPGGRLKKDRRRNSPRKTEKRARTGFE